MTLLSQCADPKWYVANKRETADNVSSFTFSILSYLPAVRHFGVCYRVLETTLRTLSGSETIMDSTKSSSCVVIVVSTTLLERTSPKRILFEIIPSTFTTDGIFAISRQNIIWHRATICSQYNLRGPILRPRYFGKLICE